MRIVITGRQGQIARALFEADSALGVEVTTVGRPELDLAEPETIEPALRAASPDIVINAAAYTAVDQAESEPEIAAKINKAGAGAVAAAAKALGAPIIHLSTDYVFDGAKTSAYVEDDPVAPASAYGASKLAGEQAVAAANCDHLILRTSWFTLPTARTLCERCSPLPKHEKRYGSLQISMVALPMHRILLRQLFELLRTC